MNPDDLTVAAGSRPWAFALADRGEAVWHCDLGDEPTTGRGADVGTVVAHRSLQAHWYALPRIRQGDLVEWRRGEAWGVAPYVRPTNDREEPGHFVRMDHPDTALSMLSMWVETVSPAPALDYREQVRIAREALRRLQVETPEWVRKEAAEALRMMDGKP